jgi:hypothetical protein
MEPGTNPARFDKAFETADDIRTASVHPITMKLLAELKPRHVFRVAIAYVVASWLVLQVWTWSRTISVRRHGLAWQIPSAAAIG